MATDWLRNINLGTLVSSGVEGNVRTVKLVLKEWNSSFTMNNGGSYKVKDFHVLYAFKIQDIIAQKGLAPKVYAYSDKPPFRMLMEYIDSVTLSSVIHHAEDNNAKGQITVDTNFLTVKSETDKYWMAYADVMKNVILAFHEIHRLGIHHGDLHTSNILVEKNNNKVFLIDFSCLIPEVIQSEGFPRLTKDATVAINDVSDVESFAKQLNDNTFERVPTYFMYRQIEKWGDGKGRKHYTRLVYVPDNISFNAWNGAGYAPMNFINYLFRFEAAKEHDNWVSFLFFALLSLKDDVRLVEQINLEYVKELCKNKDAFTECTLEIILEVLKKQPYRTAGDMRNLLRTLFYDMPPRPSTLKLGKKNVDFKLISKREDMRKAPRKGTALPEFKDPKKGLNTIWYEGMFVLLAEALAGLGCTFVDFTTDEDEAANPNDKIYQLLRKKYKLIEDQVTTSETLTQSQPSSSSQVASSSSQVASSSSTGATKKVMVHNSFGTFSLPDVDSNLLFPSSLPKRGVGDVNTPATQNNNKKPAR